MESNFVMPTWERTAWAFDYQGQQIPELGISTKQLLAIAWVKQLHRRVFGLGKTLIMHIDGEHRTGKSLTAAQIAIMLDKTFLDRFSFRMIHTAKGFLDEVAEIERNGIKGAAIVVDEAGASMNRQDYYEEFAKAINETVQILGYRHIIIIFVSPIRGFILSSLQKMTNVYVHMERTSNDYTWMFPYNLKYSSFKKGEFPRKVKINLFGTKYTLRKIKLGKPPAWLMEKYEELENLRKPIMLAKMREKGLESEIKEKKRDVYELIDMVKANPEPYLAKRSSPENLLLDRNRLSGKLGVSQATAALIKSEVEEMNYKEMKQKKLEVDAHAQSP